MVHASTVSKKGPARGKSFVVKEYNLRKKSVVVSSPMNENSFTISSNADTEALASMGKAATKSWANMHDEDDNPSKHVVDKLRIGSWNIFGLLIPFCDVA